MKGQQPRDDVDVADERDVAQDGRRRAQQGGFAPRTVISPLSGRPPRTWSNPSTIKYLRNDEVVAGTAYSYERAR